MVVPTSGTLVVAARFTRSKPRGPPRASSRISMVALAVLAVRLVAVTCVLTLTALMVQPSRPVTWTLGPSPLPPAALVVQGVSVEVKLAVAVAQGVGVGLGVGVGEAEGVGDGEAGGAPPPGAGFGAALGAWPIGFGNASSLPSETSVVDGLCSGSVTFFLSQAGRNIAPAKSTSKHKRVNRFMSLEYHLTFILFARGVHGETVDGRR